ncbi:hypothetical protein SLEP1_g57773 [Rubroshorea leprosula]|uniref:Uncharacterized protein n=1 Tax=Rubroshorea leprosula TaxID=152421 RepID=A0AAV5MM88_9ROSI|nr:hypothetical protein SLEP1_g57773 [Rubroshorea leprosula]
MLDEGLGGEPEIMIATKMVLHDWQMKEADCSFLFLPHQWEDGLLESHTMHGIDKETVANDSQAYLQHHVKPSQM